MSLSSVTEDMSIYKMRAIAAPMVRVSCLSYRVLCNKHNVPLTLADNNDPQSIPHGGGCFTEELVSLKLKRSIREVVTFPVPLPLLPVGFRLLAKDVEEAIHSHVTEKEFDDDNYDHLNYSAENEQTATSTQLTSIYVYPSEDEDEDDAFNDNNNNSGNHNKKKSEVEKDALDKIVADTKYLPYDLLPSILTAAHRNEADRPSYQDANGNRIALPSAKPQTERETQKVAKEAVEKIVAAFRAAFHLNDSNISGTTTTPAATISAEALVNFINFFNNNNASSSVLRFLHPSVIIAHVKAVEYVQYDPFKKGFRRGVAASFLPKTIVNPFPEGDIRFEHERWGNVFSKNQESSSSPSSGVSDDLLLINKPRGNDLRCSQVICQLGAANASDAREAANLIAADVDGIDVNMGCPKAFSIQNGMGAALMKIPVAAGGILRAIHDGINNNAMIEKRKLSWQKSVASTKSGKDENDTNVIAFDRKGHIVPISFKTRIYGTTEESVKHLTTVIASCIRHHANKRVRSPTDSATTAEEDTPSSGSYSSSLAAAGSDASACADFPCPLHAVSLHARTRPQRSESEPLYDQAEKIIKKLRQVQAALVRCRTTASELNNGSHEEKTAEGDHVSQTETIDTCCDASGGAEKNKPQPSTTTTTHKKHSEPTELEDFEPIFSDTSSQSLDKVASDAAPNTTIVSLSDHLQKMTFIFNGSVSATPLSNAGLTREDKSPTAASSSSIVASLSSSSGAAPSSIIPYRGIPTDTFHGALLGRSCMWDASVFNGYRLVRRCGFGTVAEAREANAISAKQSESEATEALTAASANALPFVIVAKQHIPFHELLGWILPMNFGSPQEWLAMRNKITDLERYSLVQLGRLFTDVIRYFSAYRKNTMYLKYYFTRTFGEFPVAKLTPQELEFLFVSKDAIDGFDDDEAGKDKYLLDVATEISKIGKKQRGDDISFTCIQSSNNWFDFYNTMKRFENCDWGVMKKANRRKTNAAPSTWTAAYDTEVPCVIFDCDAKAIKKTMSQSDRFLFAVMQRGDDVIDKIPKSAQLRKETM